MSTVTQLLLIRHGEVEERYHHVFGGRIDMELSARGQQQAQAMADYLRGRPVDALYSSSMKRARATSKPIAEALSLDPTFLDTIREVDFGDWTGHHWNEIQPKFGVSAFAWLDEYTSGRIPNAEPLADYSRRVEDGLQKILTEQPGRTTAVVCHGGVIRMMLSLMLKQPLAEMAKVHIEYAGLTRVLKRADRVEVDLLNFTPWRDLA